MDEKTILQKLNDELLALEKEHDDYLDYLTKIYKEGARTAEFLEKKENRDEDTICWLIGHISNVARAAEDYHSTLSRIYQSKELLRRIQS